MQKTLGLFSVLLLIQSQLLAKNEQVISIQSDTPVPIILLDFRFTKTTNGATRIQWTLAPTDQTLIIHLLHSKDNRTWNSTWTSTEPLNGSIKTYEFVPTECFGNNYYKVQIIPNGDDTINSRILTVPCENSRLVAYPNPSHDFLTIRSLDKHYQLYSSTGIQYTPKGQAMNANEYRLDLRELKPGYYVLVVGRNKLPFLRL